MATWDTMGSEAVIFIMLIKIIIILLQFANPVYEPDGPEFDYQRLDPANDHRYNVYKEPGQPENKVNTYSPN